MSQDKKLARRYNENKLRYELISHVALKKLAKVYTLGANKYTLRDDKGNIIEDGSGNWKTGLPWMSTIASVQRHIEAWKEGFDLDDDLGTEHLANAAWGLFSLLEYAETHPELDDRELWYNKPFKRIYLDLDGVCVDFETHFLKYFDLEDHDATDWNDHRFRNNIHKVCDNVDFWLSCPPLINPEQIVYPISGYCTARACSKEIVEKWLEINKFPAAEVLNVGFDESKTEILKDKCDIILDDSIKNFVELNSNGIQCYLMTRPHNIKYSVGYRRIDNIDDFFKKII